MGQFVHVDSPQAVGAGGLAEGAELLGPERRRQVVSHFDERHTASIAHPILPTAEPPGLLWLFCDGYGPAVLAVSWPGRSRHAGLNEWVPHTPHLRVGIFHEGAGSSCWFGLWALRSENPQT